MDLTLSIGIAKPILSIEASDKPDDEYLAFVIPTTSPYILNSAPPELPEFIAVSVCIRFMVVFSVVTVLSRALTTPAVSEKVSSPSGLPIATTSSPTDRSVDEPRTTGVRPSASILRTATSLLSSLPISSASSPLVSSSPICTLKASPCTTCALVTI